MKLNWGFGIAAVYSIFALSMIYMAVKSSSQDHSLVVENYYEKDLQYQQQLDKLVNSQSIGEVTVALTADQHFIQIQFPENIGTPQGNIQFYNPVNKRLDFNVAVNVSGTPAIQLIDRKAIQPGRWKVKIDWKSGETAYYHEKELLL